MQRMRTIAQLWILQQKKESRTVSFNQSRTKSDFQKIIWERDHLSNSVELTFGMISNNFGGSSIPLQCKWIDCGVENGTGRIENGFLVQLI